MPALRTQLQTIHTLSDLRKRDRNGRLGHAEGACLCYKPGYRPPPAKCRYVPEKGRWFCGRKKRRPHM